MPNYTPALPKKIFHLTRRAFARNWRAILDKKVKFIGITGSYSKTSTSTAIASVLLQKFQVLQTDTNLDTVYNIPITLLKLRPFHDYAVIEYGIDHLGEMDQHLSLVTPEIGILTGITPVHADKSLLGSLENIVAEKIKLLKAVPDDGIILLNYDDPVIRSIPLQQFKAKIITYGIDHPADYRASKVSVAFNGTVFEANYSGGKYKFTIGFIGRHFAQSGLAALAVGHLAGMRDQQIAKGLRNLKPLIGRMSVEKGPRGTWILNDSKRANPASTTAGLQTLKEIKTKGKKIAVLAKMGELGKYEAEEHKKIGTFLAQAKPADVVITIGETMKLAADQAKKKGLNNQQVITVPDTQQAANELKKRIHKDDIIYLKGSLSQQVDKVLDYL